MFMHQHSHSIFLLHGMMEKMNFFHSDAYYFSSPDSTGAYRPNTRFRMVTAQAPTFVQ